MSLLKYMKLLTFGFTKGSTDVLILSDVWYNVKRFWHASLITSILGYSRKLKRDYKINDFYYRNTEIQSYIKGTAPYNFGLFFWEISSFFVRKNSFSTFDQKSIVCFYISVDNILKYGI